MKFILRVRVIILSSNTTISSDEYCENSHVIFKAGDVPNIFAFNDVTLESDFEALHDSGKFSRKSEKISIFLLPHS